MLWYRRKVGCCWKGLNCIFKNLLSVKGRTPSLSAINVGNQQITKQTPNFTPNNVKLGVFVLFKKTAERLCIDQ